MMFLFYSFPLHVSRRGEIVVKYEQEKAKKERDAKRKTLQLKEDAEDHKLVDDNVTNKHGNCEAYTSTAVKEERDSEETKESSTDSEKLQTAKKSVDVKTVFSSTPVIMKNNAKV